MPPGKESSPLGWKDIRFERWGELRGYEKQKGPRVLWGKEIYQKAEEAQKKF